MRKNILTIALIMGLAVLTSAPALPQAAATLGTIEGSVKDATGGRLPGTSVTLRNDETGFVRTVLTNQNGNFKAPLLPLGPYTLTIELSGFQTLVRDGIILTIASTVTLPELTVEVGDGRGDGHRHGRVAGRWRLADPCRPLLSRKRPLQICPSTHVTSRISLR